MTQHQAVPGPNTVAPEPAGGAAPTSEARLAAHAANLGRMYGMLAHDLFAHMNSMVLNLELLQRAAADPESEGSGERVRRYARLMTQELSDLDRMLKAVLAQVRLAQPPSEQFDFRTLCEELTIVFTSYARQRRIKAQATLADVPMIALGDRDVVRHAMTAVLIAAIEALPEGTLLSLSLRGDRRLAVFTASAELAETGPPGASAVWTRGLESDVAAARAILEARGARLLITSKPHEPARLEIEIPLAPIGA